MSATGFRRSSPRARRERGFILVTGLLFLVVMTLLGLALFRSTGLMDRITANTRDKQRSFEAAQSAMEYGAWWLAQSTGGGAALTCSNNNATATVATLHVCKEALSTSLSSVGDLTTWAANAFTYTPPGMTVVTGGGGMSANNSADINYNAAPGLYIEKVGLTSDGKGTYYQYYQITAFGFGGDANTASVLRSTFKQSAGTKCKSCTP